VKQWNARIAEGDAYLVVTPEYNHSIPAILKNAIDTVFMSFAFRNKPAAFVGYSSGASAGIRAIEHLAHTFIEAEGVPLRNTVPVGRVAEAFDDPLRRRSYIPHSRCRRRAARPPRPRGLPAAAARPTPPLAAASDASAS
jgi:NAD(P)H-dependent FMN reductase